MPSLFPGFEYDIFISYRQNDNRSGWVTGFVRSLQEELAATIKDPVSIYFDENPYDGLLETHNVDKSLEGKLKCLIFIPIISQTYCDPKSFAWQNEFRAFNKLTKEDQFGRDVKLGNGNVASRILPVRIHDLDTEDKTLLENELSGPLRSVEFIYKSAGVNRPLNVSDNPEKNLNKTLFRDQINKVANASKEIVLALKSHEKSWSPVRPAVISGYEATPGVRKNILRASAVTLLIALASYFSYYSIFEKNHTVQKLDKSIAILPFENLSGDPTQDYFSDGIAEEILNALVQIKDLKVPGRTSSFQFKGKAVDLQEVGRKLKVSTVLEGSVRRQGNHIRITAQLISVEDGYHLWSQQFDRTVDDVIAIQEEIARTIVQRLKVTLLENENLDIVEGLTTNKRAYDAYLKGRFYWNRRQMKESEQFYKQAIGLDSSFASAYAGLAEAYVTFPFFSNGGFPRQYMPMAKEVAEKAIHLNSSLAEPYAVLGFKNCFYDRNPEQAKKYFEKAIQLNPKSVTAHYWYGQFVSCYAPDSLIALEELHKALELDPLSAVTHNVLGVILRNYKRYDEAIESIKVAIEINPQYTNAYVNMGLCYLGLGQEDEALKAFREAAGQSRISGALARLVYFYVKEGKVDQAKAIFTELMDKSKKEYVSKSNLAIAAFYLSQKDLAHELLKEAYEERDPFLVTGINQHPIEFFSEPRNIELRKQLNFPKGR